MEEYQNFLLSLIIEMAVNCMGFTLTEMVSFLSTRERPFIFLSFVPSSALINVL